MEGCGSELKLNSLSNSVLDYDRAAENLENLEKQSERDCELSCRK